jgi:hypothetical protein
MGVNPELLKLARYHIQKNAFVPAGDPAMGADPAAGGAPMDPAAAGGAPPMDPMAAGGAPPMDPMAAGGGDPMAQIMPMIQQAVQQAMAANGGGGAGGAAPGEAAIKPKIDINIEVMQMKKLLAKLCDAMGVQIPAAEMVATPEDLTQMAQGGPGYAAVTPDSGGAMGAIQPPAPIDPMKAAEAWEAGVAFTPPAAYDFQNAHAVTKNTANMATAMLMRNRAKVS